MHLGNDNGVLKMDGGHQNFISSCAVRRIWPTSPKRGIVDVFTACACHRIFRKEKYCSTSIQISLVNFPSCAEPITQQPQPVAGMLMTSAVTGNPQ